MKPKIVIAGGTGFIGRSLLYKYEQEGYEVKIISRRQGMIRWEDTDAVIEAIDGAEMLINLAGKSVNCRYTRHNKEQIVQSRVKTTRLLGEAIRQCLRPPTLWINMSTATIYRDATDRPMTETQGEIGTGFSVDVARRWERAFFKFKLPGTRMVALRTAIVLGSSGGALEVYRRLVRLGLGGKQGSGGQMLSWIHEDDLFHIIDFLQQDIHAKGIYNCASPNPIRNEQFMDALRAEMGVFLGIPLPMWLLKFGAVFIKTEPELVLKSRWVLPERLIGEGFQFRLPEIIQALKSILHPQINNYGNCAYHPQSTLA